ncbi:hypothetical protein R3P38DRAFT_2918502 [Favolaschia claudopus]|uniref:F-box domain-containing protein n=1 Tax=Favolaschia claudopus TaxID=2862362 RepID=A0AAW0C0L8_9AGAR
MAPPLKKQHFDSTTRSPTTISTTLPNRAPTDQAGDPPVPANLPNVPLDIHFEIFRYIHPRDLIAVARSCKPLRDILLDKQLSQPTWRRALSYATMLPSAPEALPEPVMAVLLYEPTCTKCRNALPIASRVDWELKARFCASCREASVTCFPSGTKPELCCGVLAHLVVPTQFASSSGASGCYLTSEFNLAKAKVSRMSAQERTTFVSNKQRQMEDLRSYARECRKFEEAQQRERLERDKMVKVQRAKLIRERLFSLGWGEELAVLKAGDSPLEQHPVVDVPEVLTDTAWLEIRPVLEAFLQKHRATQKAKHQAHLKKASKARFESARKMEEGLKGGKENAQPQRKGKGQKGSVGGHKRNRG